MPCDAGRAGRDLAALDSAGSDAAVWPAMGTFAAPLCRRDQPTIESGANAEAGSCRAPRSCFSVTYPFESLVAALTRAALAASECRCDQRTIDTPLDSTAGRTGSTCARADSSCPDEFVLPKDCPWFSAGMPDQP
jgi:hypothetical protein